MRFNNFIKIAFFLIATVLTTTQKDIQAQLPMDNKLKLSGELRVDERFLLKENKDWAWNETRLSLNLDKNISGNSSFRSEIWLRNLGLPKLFHSAELYNKEILDPYNLEIREAFVRINGFLTENLDLSIGRQRIVWGTADKLNPTDNLNPLDLEDILDFGRRRGSDALNLQYYFNNRYSLQAVYLPFFRPANLPVGIFASALNPEIQLPPGVILKGTTDTLLMPRYNLSQSATYGLKLKGFAGGMDFSFSYVNGIDGLPFSIRNTIVPADASGGVNISSQLSFVRNHIIGADLATSIGGMGFWAEAALYIPEEDVVMTNDLTALFPLSPEPVTKDSLLLDNSKPYLKFIAGSDYFFADGSYFNFQYMHGFMHERGRKNLNDYFFVQYEKRFLNEKLRIAPVAGAFIVSKWNQLKNNYALVYMPEISYQASVNAEITLSAVLFDGKGENLFAGLNEYNMFIFKMIYSF